MASKKSVPPKYEGGCLCGQVSYASTGDPVFQVNCHCRDCQKTTGCAYAPVMFFVRDALKISGELTYHATTGGSGRTISRGFCSNCGAQVVGDADMVGTLLSVRAGTLDDPDLYQPKANVFVSQAAAWDAMDPQLPKFDRWPSPRS
ncbi:MAG: GFA family protein [Dokdonella sp.]